jgi:hypothetical protein
MTRSDTINKLEEDLNSCSRRLRDFADQAAAAEIVKKHITSFINHQRNGVIQSDGDSGGLVFGLKIFNLKLRVRAEMGEQKTDSDRLQLRFLAYVVTTGPEGELLIPIGDPIDVTRFSGSTSPEIVQESDVFSREFLVGLLRGVINLGSSPQRDPKLAITL